MKKQEDSCFYDKQNKRKRRKTAHITLAAGAVVLVIAAGLLLPRIYQSGDSSNSGESPSGALDGVQRGEVVLPPADEGSEASGSPHEARARELMEQMTLQEKVCQLFIVYPEQLTGGDAPTTADEALRQGLQAYPVAGLLMNKSHLVSKEQAKALLAGAQDFSKTPLILTCDEEGGRVARVMTTIGTTYFGPMLDYRDLGAQTAFENARIIGADLYSLGFNMDLAPVADVWSNPENTVIGDRAYSNDFQQAAELVAAAVKGFHSGGVACSLKHFPGHGDTSADSHFGSVYISKTLDEIRAQELVPFKAGIAAGADAVMAGHLIVSDAGEEPAPFSYRLITELLRGELGFDGVVITDGLQMQAMTDHYSSAEIARKAVAAGVDLLLCPDNLPEAVAALTSAVEDGEIPLERLEQSVTRILELKLANHMITP